LGQQILTSVSLEIKLFTHNKRQLGQTNVYLSSGEGLEQLPRELKDTHVLSIFKAKLKTFLNHFS